MRILVLDLMSKRPMWRMPEWVARRVAGTLDDTWELRVVHADTDSDGDGGEASEETMDAVRGAEVYMGYGVPRPVWIAAKPSVRWIHSAAAGVGSAISTIAGADVLLTNSAGIHAEPMADWVLASVLHFTRGLDLATRNQQRVVWDKEAFTGGVRVFPELDGLSVGILGLGGIGRAVARRCAALGMTVRGVRRRSGPVPHVQEVLPFDELAQMARVSNVLVVAAPLTDETRGCIDDGILAQMPDDGIVVNVSRGRIVDEQALLTETERGRLRAALDVFTVEPLPPDHPFWRSANVLVNAHVSPVTDQFWERQTDLMLDNVNRYRSGKTLRNVVDAEVGY